MLKYIALTPGQRFLDVACGQARMVELAQSDYGVIGFGTDLSFSALKSSVNIKQLYVADGEHLPIRSNSIDRLTNIGSLEHYVDPGQGVREITRILSKTGLACIVLPNLFGAGSNIIYSFHHGDIIDDGQPIQRYSTRKGWQMLLEDNGLKILKTFKYEREWPSNLHDLWHYIKRPKELLHLLISPWVPLNLANCFIFICQPKGSPL